MTTAAEHLAAAAAHETEASASFDRCDTDGFLTQWAHGRCADLERRKAQLAEAGGQHTFPALFDLSGNLVAAKLVDSKFGGQVWGILASDDPDSRIVKWIGAFPKRATTMSGKGYYEGRVNAPADAKMWAPPGATGLGGAMSVRAVIYRTDGGFSRTVQIIDNGNGTTA